MSQNETSTSALANAGASSTQIQTRAFGLPTAEDIRVIEYLGKTYIESGLAPAGVKNWQAAVIAIQAGRELGIPPTVAIREIYVVKGRPSCSSQLMMALVRAAYGPSAMRVKSNTATECTVEYRIPGWDGTSSVTFTIDDARKAGLLSNDTWSKYPRAMLRNRAISEAARSAFPDAILGMYTPEEMGAPVDEEGRIVVTGTVIDHETGEVLEAPETDPMAALHAEGAKHGIKHPAFSAWAKATLKAGSLADVDGSLLARMAKRLRVEEGFAEQFRAKYQPDDVPDTVQQEDEPIDAEYTEVGSDQHATAAPLPLSDEDYAAINEQFEREQKAKQARGER